MFQMKKPKRKKSIIVRLIVLGVSVYMIVTLIGLGNQLERELETLEQQEKYLNTVQLEVEELKALLESDSHSAIIEKVARERLGYVYSNEEIYIDISGN